MLRRVLTALRIALLNAGKGFLAAYAGKAALTSLSVAAGRRTVTGITRPFTAPDAIQFGTFVGAMLGTWSLSRRAMIVARGKSDSWTDGVAGAFRSARPVVWCGKGRPFGHCRRRQLPRVVAGKAAVIHATCAGYLHVLTGAIAGLCIVLDSPSRRAAVAVYCFCRAMYMLVKLAMRVGTLPRVRHLAVWLFGTFNAPIMFAFLLEPKLLDEVRATTGFSTTLVRPLMRYGGVCVCGCRPQH